MCETLDVMTPMANPNTELVFDALDKHQVQLLFCLFMRDKSHLLSKVLAIISVD